MLVSFAHFEDISSGKIAIKTRQVLRCSREGEWTRIFESVQRTPQACDRHCAPSGFPRFHPEILRVFSPAAPPSRRGGSGRKPRRTERLECPRSVFQEW